MVDLLVEDQTPDQEPTLSELEEARADAEKVRRVTIAWLMASEDAPDPEALLSELVNRPEWHGRAACRGIGTELFFPAHGVKLDAATTVCDGCDVRSECLASSLQHGDRHGVWGGVSERGRRFLRRGAA